MSLVLEGNHFKQRKFYNIMTCDVDVFAVLVLRAGVEVDQLCSSIR